VADECVQRDTLVPSLSSPSSVPSMPASAPSPASAAPQHEAGAAPGSAQGAPLGVAAGGGLPDAMDDAPLTLHGHSIDTAGGTATLFAPRPPDLPESM
jgi:hypothetical protein